MLPILPQLVPQLDNPSVSIHTLVRSLLVSAGAQYFQDVFFPLNLAAHDGSTAAHDVLVELRLTHEAAAHDADLFFDGLVRAACTWFESWKAVLEMAAHSESRRDALLRPKFAEFANLICALHRYFVRLYGPIVRECEALFRQRTDAALRSMWVKLRRLSDR
jgi:hypothetical protein